MKMTYKEQATLELIKVMAKAATNAKQAGRSVVESQDVVAAMLVTPDTGAGRLLSRQNVSKRNFTKELTNARVVPAGMGIVSYDQPELNYRTSREFYRELLATTANLHREQGAVEVDLCPLPVTEPVQRALEYASEVFVQRSEREGIDTSWVLDGLTQEVESNAFVLLVRLLAKEDRLNEVTEQALGKQLIVYRTLNFVYVDGLRRHEEGQKAAKAKQLTQRLQNPDHSFVNELTTDLVAAAKAGQLSPMIGREAEMEQLCLILNRKNKRNPLLSGPAGVGKTALVEGLALKIAAQTAGALNNKRLLTLDITKLHPIDLARRVIIELAQEQNVIIFIDEIHLLACQGRVAELMKPLLARGDLSIIGASTPQEWRLATQDNPALQRRFETVTIDEPSIEETTAIVKRAIAPYENFFAANYTDEVLAQAAPLAKQAFPTRMLPDIAFTMLDNAGALVASRVGTAQTAADQAQRLLDQLKQEITEAKQVRYNEQTTAQLRQRFMRLTKEVKAQQNQTTRQKYERQITLADLQAVIKQANGQLPLSKAEKTQQLAKLAQLKSTLQTKILEQTEAIEVVSKAVLRAKAGLSMPNKPLAVLGFFGPTGVGKTEVAKVIAQEAFDGHLIRYDMSEFKGSGSSNKLLRADPGYIGYGRTKTIVQKIQETPNAVLLFDEIEKADPEVYDLFLQLFDEGKLTDSQGEVGDFSRALIILTSNLGAKRAVEQVDLAAAFRAPGSEKNEATSETLKAVSQFFRPELLNRLSKQLVFKQLSFDDLKQITMLKLDQLVALTREQGLKIEYGEDVVELIATKYNEPEKGARPLERGIEVEVKDPLAEALATGQVKQGDQIILKVLGGQVVVESSAEAVQEWLPTASFFDREVAH